MLPGRLLDALGSCALGPKTPGCSQHGKLLAHLARPTVQTHTRSEPGRLHLAEPIKGRAGVWLTGCQANASIWVEGRKLVVGCRGGCSSRGAAKGRWVFKPKAGGCGGG